MLSKVEHEKSSGQGFNFPGIQLDFTFDKSLHDIL